MNAKKITYFVSTGLFSVLMLMSAGMYIFNNAQVQAAFTSLGFPTYIIYPLALAKILGIVAIWVKKPRTLKEWAYAGFFFNTLLAASAHLMVSDGQHFGALMAMVLVLTSYNTHQD